MRERCRNMVGYFLAKMRVFEIIEKGRKNDRRSLIFDWIIISLIVINTIFIILQSIENISYGFQAYMRRFEIISVIIFTIEYTLRVWTAEFKMEENNRLKARIKYMLTPMALIDLFAILPFYLPMFFAIDLTVLRVIRLVRVLRILKLNRYSKSLKLINTVLKKEKESLYVLFSMTAMLLLVSATLIYYAEHDVQPGAFPNIIASLWWAVITLTTVGYGDVYPITTLGKVFTTVIAFLGVGLVALPAAILSSGFMRYFKEREVKAKRRHYKNCPMCAEKILKEAKVCKHCHYNLEKLEFEKIFVKISDE